MKTNMTASAPEIPSDDGQRRILEGEQFRIAASIDWQAPEPLSVERRPLPPLDEVLLPPPLRAWLVDIAERIQCPLEYPTASAIVALASVVGRRCAIRPKQYDDWTVIPNLWGLVVGDPGMKKSAPVQEALKPLDRIQRDAIAAHEAAKIAHASLVPVIDAQIAKLHEQIEDVMSEQLDAKHLEEKLAELMEEREEPKLHRYKVQDTTVEKLGEILANAPYGVLLFRDEMQGWLKSLAKEGQESSRAFYLETWNGNGSYTFDRIRRGTIHIKAACISIMGTIQPGPLGEYLHDAVANGMNADGLMQRFQIAVFPDPPASWQKVDRLPDLKAKTGAWFIFERLVGLETSPPAGNGIEISDSGVPCLRFHPQAQECFDGWLESLERWLLAPDEHPAIVGHLAKYRSLMPSLALLFHLVDWASDASGQRPLGPVSLDAAERAVKWCRFLAQHARRLYALAARDVSQATILLAKKLQRGKLRDGFTRRDVIQRHWAGLGRDTVSAALDELTEMHWLTACTVPTKGRPRQAYFINPGIKSRW